MAQAELLQCANALLGEGPIWDEVEQAYFWGDLKSHRIFRFDPESGQSGIWTLPYQFGCFALREQGGMCVVTDHGYEFLNLGTGDLSRVVDPEADLAFDHCYNDGKVDPGGRFWVGSLPIAGARGEEITEDTGRLYSLAPDGDVRCHDDGLFVSNGMGWSPGADRMYHIDSWRGTVFAHDFDNGTGQLSNKREFFTFTDDADGFPDGMTVDAEGGLWIAMWDGWKIVNISKDGTRLGEVEMPVQKPTSCCFGGKNLDQLFVTSASVYMTSAELEKNPQAGSIFGVVPGVTGLPSLRFKG